MLSNSCKYGIRAVIYIATQPTKSGKIGIKKISEDLNLPTPFLAKILQQLAKYKILSSSKGPHGGFSLLKDPKEITLLDIIKIIDNDDIFLNCVMHNYKCTTVGEQKLKCPLHDDYEKIRENLKKLFESRTIYEIVKKANKSETIVI